MLRAYVETAWLPDIARPILVPTGPGGSGKTTLCRLVKRLLDPAAPESIGLDQRDILQKASHCAVVFLDNVSGLPDWAINALCRLCTGEGDSKRQLYSDDDDVIVELQRLVLVNGINPPADRADFSDRVLPILLDRITEPLAERTLWARVACDLPGWLGALCDGIAGILAREPALEVAELPRLADWGRVAAASYVGAGLEVAQFVEDWRHVVLQQQAGVIEGSSLAQCVLCLMAKHEQWSGSSSDLHGLLEQEAESLRINLRKDDSWPKSPTWLRRRLVEIGHVLRARGVVAERSRTDTERTITLRHEPPPEQPRGGPEMLSLLSVPAARVRTRMTASRARIVVTAMPSSPIEFNLTAMTAMTAFPGTLRRPPPMTRGRANRATRKANGCASPPGAGQGRRSPHPAGGQPAPHPWAETASLAGHGAPRPQGRGAGVPGHPGW